MRFLLDTNVISELVKPAPSETVIAWVRAQSSLDLALSVLSLGEVRCGIALMAKGARRTRLERWAETELPRQFIGRCLPIDDAIVIAWGELDAAARKAHRPLPAIDGLLLATAYVHELTLVTRNVGDCDRRGVEILNPWE